MSYNIQGHAAIRREDHLPKLAEVIAAAHLGKDYQVSKIVRKK